jgi:hypothetical protein
MAMMEGMRIDCDTPVIDSGPGEATGHLMADKSLAVVGFPTGQLQMADLSPLLIALQLIAQEVYIYQKQGVKDC